MKLRNILMHYFTALLTVTLSINASAQINQSVGPQSDGSILVPSNQWLRPAGSQIIFPGRPVDLALSPDERQLIVKNSSSLDLINLSDNSVAQSLPYERGGASFTGLCLSNDGSHVYVTNAEDLVMIAGRDNNGDLQWQGSIVLPEPAIGGYPVPGGLALNKTEDLMYVTLSRSNSLAVINLADTSISEIPVGIAPYDVMLLSSEKAYVSNWGGRKPAEGEPVYNTSGSKVLVDPETGIANHGSISVVDLRHRILEKDIEVGLHPSEMVLSPDKTRLYVACANSDVISVIDTKSDKVIERSPYTCKQACPLAVHRMHCQFHRTDAIFMLPTVRIMPSA